MNSSALAGAALGTGIVAGMLLVVVALVGRDPQRPIRPPGRIGAVHAWWRDPSRRRRLAAALAVGLVVLGVSRWPVLATACATGVLAMPKILAGREAERNVARLEALEQWVRGVSDRLAAGHGLEQALAQAGRNIPSPIATQVAALQQRLQVHRMPTEQALRIFGLEVADPMGDKIAIALMQVAVRRGSGATTALAGLATMIARDVTDRREVDAARAEHRNTVKIVILVVGAFTVLAMLQGAYIQPYGTPLGQIVLALVACFYGAALWWLRRLAAERPGYRLLQPTEESRS